MIRVERLTKSYGPTQAVRGISFEVPRGEVVGFLGPNGSGKTTTMRMLTTYLEPTSGRAWMAGHDVLDAPLEVRRRVGYLPESVPLYPEMRVRDYLRFRAKLRDVPGSRRPSAIDKALRACHLDDVATRIIGQLSRGYRQRVGLADALLHEPEILILDEPTAGLDPIQTREVRALIRGLAGERTLLLSTHILSEVEAVCGRALVIASGKIVLDRPLGGADSGGLIAEVRGPAEEVRRAIAGLPGVAGAEILSAEGEWATLAIHGGDVREALAHRVVERGWGLRRLDLRRGGLEEEFIQAVSRAAEGTEAEAAA